MFHFYDVDVAKKHGVIAAVLLQNIAFWVEHNKANDKHFHDGYYWTYNSMKAFEELFPEFTPKQIRKSLENLRADGILLVGNYNTLKYDRTLWYTIAEKSFCPGGQMKKPCGANEFDTEGEPIPYINTDSKQDYSFAEAKLPENCQDIIGVWEKHVRPMPSSTLVQKILTLVDEVGFSIYKEACERAEAHNKRAYAWIEETARRIYEGNDFNDKKPKVDADALWREMEKLKNNYWQGEHDPILWKALGEISTYTFDCAYDKDVPALKKRLAETYLRIKEEESGKV